MIQIEQRWLKRDEVSKYLSVHSTSVYRMVRDGRIPKPHHLGPGVSRWDKLELDAALQNNGAT